MASVISKRIVLEEVTCAVCGIDFAIPDWLKQKRHEDGREFYCPQGHSLTFTKPEIDKLREKVGRLEAQAIHLEDQRRAAERSASAYKGQVTALRQRVANGVCPCCHRSFTNVARHMANKHPGYADDEATR
jgi:hypothetical protein